MKHKVLVWLALAAVVACAALTPGPALAADDGVEGYSLSLAEALRMSLENNLDLVSARIDPAISENNVVSEQAGFDFGLSVDTTHTESKQEISNLFSLNEFKQDSGSVSFSKDLMFGADFGVDLNLDRDQSAGPLVVTAESYRANVGFNFNLPIFGTSNRGTAAGRLGATQRLVLAQGNLAISEETLRTEAHRVMVDVESAYWNVVANIATLGTRQLALKRSQGLLDLNAKKVKVGTLAPIEITAAEAEVASNEQDVIVAETELENSEDELRRLLGVPPDDPLWSMPMAPTDRPDFVEQRIDLEDVVSTALTNRPEMRSARRQLANDELSEKVARRQTRPGVSLNGSVRPSGNNFESFPDPMAPSGFTQVTKGTFDESLSEVKDFDNYTWTVGANVSYTIGNRASKAAYANAGLSRQKSALAVRNQEQLIRVDARRAVRAVDSGMKRVQAARKNVELQKKKLDAEEKKFDNGMSTSFDVLTSQRDLATSELTLIQAGLDYARALTALERSKGTLLESRGLELGSSE